MLKVLRVVLEAILCLDVATAGVGDDGIGVGDAAVSVRDILVFS